MKYTKEGVENIISAIVEQAATDYELLISDKPLPVSEDSKYFNIQELRLFARDQKITDINVTGIFETIDRRYKKFRKVVREHHKEIIEDWNIWSPKYMNNYNIMNKKMRYHCPLCGSFLRPGSKKNNDKGYIKCTRCSLNMRIPKEE